jgi:hypothetical protein
MLPIHTERILRRELEARELSANPLAIELKLPSDGSGTFWAASEGSRRIPPCGWRNSSATARASAQFADSLRTRRRRARDRSANSRRDQARAGGGVIASVLDVALRE